MKAIMNVTKFFTFALGITLLPQLFAQFNTFDPRFPPAGMSPISTMEQPSNMANGGICNPATNPRYAPLNNVGMESGMREYQVPGAPHGPMTQPQFR